MNTCEWPLCYEDAWGYHGQHPECCYYHAKVRMRLVHLDEPSVWTLALLKSHERRRRAKAREKVAV